MNVSFLLDESGSMSAVLNDTIGGFNTYVDTLKELKGVRFTLTKFGGDRVDIVHSKVKRKKIKHLTTETYKPLGWTPLYDAIGRTVGESGKGLFIIMTDGQENSSREYTKETIFNLIQQKQEEGWEFVFLGADQESYEAGLRLGTRVAAQYNPKNMGETFSTVSAGTRQYSSTGTVNEEDWLPKKE